VAGRLRQWRANAGLHVYRRYRRREQTVLTDDSADSGIINVGNTDNIDIQTLAEVIRDKLAPELVIGFTGTRQGGAAHTHANIGKANELLSYEPTRDIREGVRESIEWYQVNRDWYEPLVRRS
jgi:UDP-glucose 4-epimerase